MNDGMLTVSNSEFGKLEILMEDGKELFPARQCAKMLGYNNSADAVTRHCRAIVKRDNVDSAGRKQTMQYIPEGDLYRLIIRSRLPAAQKFEKWLFDEVLPELRRTGGYRAKPDTELPHQWMGRGCIIVDEVVKRLGVKKDKVVGLLRQRKTVYRIGVDWETLRGTELDEYKFYNRVGSVAKGLLIVYDTGYAKLRWELLGEGTPDTALPMSVKMPLHSLYGMAYRWLR